MIFFFLFIADCDQGFYCSGAANTSAPTDGVTGDVCPSGTYCPVGTDYPKDCPDGKTSLV